MLVQILINVTWFGPTMFSTFTIDCYHHHREGDISGSPQGPTSPLNWAFGCAPRHPFLIDALSELSTSVLAYTPKPIDLNLAQNGVGVPRGVHQCYAIV